MEPIKPQRAEPPSAKTPLEVKLTAADLNVGPRALELLSRLDAQGVLSVGWPGNVCDCPRSYLTWSRAPLPIQKTTAIVSSRLGRKLDRRDALFAVLRVALAQLDPRHQVLLTARGTTTHRFLKRASELFGIPSLDVEVAEPRQTLEQWAERLLRALGGVAPNACFVSNVLHSAPSEPVRDQVEVFGSSQLLVLHARRDGNLHKLIRRRLEVDQLSRVFLAIGNEHLVSKPLADELMAEGAVGWWVSLDGCESRVPLSDTTRGSPSKILTQHNNPSAYLTHCTRGIHGAWPNQSEEEYLDELILGQPARDRSSLAALMRIVRMERLLGSGSGIRGASTVVSFTSAPFNELVNMRAYRPHRGRWDFEPYGISIDRDLLAKRGARPVIYGEERVWESLPRSERPFFQKAGTQNQSIDWRIEQEWRLLGDLNLADIPADKAVVFVPSRCEADHLAQVSRWPVIITK